MAYYVGIDGCKAGWFAVIISSRQSWAFNVYDDITQLWNKLKDAELLLIDIPIGLLEDGEAGRTCDIMARKILGRPRASSVFPPPVRIQNKDGRYL
jgi:predicted RNase H-like nuclease